MAIGPFDGRIKRTRCSACISHHLKCEGGLPCKYCLRTQQLCNIPKTSKAVKFVRIAVEPSNRGLISFRANENLPQPISSPVMDLLITHFQKSFIRSNSLTGRCIEDFEDVHSLVKNSPALQYAIMAVSTRDVKKKGYSGTLGQYTAFQYYRAAVSLVQSDLAQQNVATSISFLWSTFLLGIFELMCDASGEGWIKHFLYGSAALLRHRGAAAYNSGPGRRFFLTTRVFEISRALIFSSESFLAQEEWRSLMTNMWSGIDAKDWHPKEALFDLMIACSTLGIRAIESVHSIKDCPEVLDKTVLIELAQNGLSLQSALFDWRVSADQWADNHQKSPHDAQMILAIAYYHAISIYLSGIFDYYSHWSDRRIPTPTLSSSDIQAHVLTILDVVGLALKEGTLAGILFFFPLRVAGARARTLEERHEIFSLLHSISNRGYAVAEAFLVDLNNLWDSRPVETSLQDSQRPEETNF